MEMPKGVDMLAKVLLIIGGLNWGLVGVANLNVVEMIFGSIPILLTLVYVLVGLSALYMLYVMMMMKK